MGPPLKGPWQRHPRRGNEVAGRQRAEDGVLRQALRQLRFGAAQQLLIQPGANLWQKNECVWL